MHGQIGPVFLGGLGALFGGYGVGELVLAYRTPTLQAWRERALPGGGGIIVAALFVVMIRQVLG